MLDTQGHLVCQVQRVKLAQLRLSICSRLDYLEIRAHLETLATVVKRDFQESMGNEVKTACQDYLG